MASEETNLDLVAKLSVLKPLPKAHYFWPLVHENLTDESQLYELARITHTMCIGGWYTQEEVDRCVYMCARVNKTNPVIKASLGVNFSPWHTKFGKDLPPTDRGPTYWEELRYFEERAQLVKQWIEQSNKKYGSDVEVGAVTLDQERLIEKPGDNTWNEGIREALDAIHIRAKTIFTTARIEWYGRGVYPAQEKTGWAKSNNFTGKEILSSLSISLYSLPNLEQMREAYRRTCKLADELGVEDVTPWVALGAGYQPSQRSPHKWYFDWNYDLKYSYQMGAELNIPRFSEQPNRYAPYNRAKIVVLYPSPFNKQTPSWTRHFIAYVRGATGVKDFGDEE